MELRTLKHAPEVMTVVLDGRMDAAGASSIDHQLNEIAGSYRELIVDLSAVHFLASAGIRTLLSAAKTLQRQGGTLVLLAPQPDIAAVLEVTGILDLLPVALTQEDAARKIGLR